MALIVAVALQIAFAFEWHRLQPGHGAWLLAAIVLETGAALVLAVFLARPTRAVVSARFASLARLPVFLLLALFPILAMSAKSGFSRTTLCWPENYCGPDPDQVIEFTSGHPVNVSLLQGPAGSQGAVALDGRRLAVAASSWRKQTTGGAELSGFRKGPVDLAVWEGRWPASLPGPCGRLPRPDMDRLAPMTQTDCDVLYPPSHRGAVWREVARVEGAKVGAVAIAYRSDDRLAIAYSRPDGIYFAEAPSWRPERLLDTRAESIRLAPLPGGDLALAAIVTRPGGSELELIRTRGGRWSRPISVAARPELSMVSTGSQVVLLFRDRQSRLVLERRTDGLALLEHRTFGVRTCGALGNLRGDEIGVAIADPLRGHALRLRLFRVSRGEVALLTRERLAIYGPGVIATTPTTLAAGIQKAQVYSPRPAGVVQTGQVVRALYAGSPHGHTAEHVALSFWLEKGGLAFASDWPRWVVLEQKPESDTTFGKPSAHWTSFNLTLFQPPERQLVNEKDS